MSALEIHVLPDADAVSEAVATRMAGAILRALSAEENAHICLTGGRGGHGALTHLARDTGIDWSRVHVWWSDERFVPAGDALRNDLMADDALLHVVGVPVANVHRMPSTDTFSDAGEAARAYSDELAEFGDPAPEFCVSILGVGEDGHVASLFPEHPGLRETRTAFAVSNSPKPPPVRVSMSFDTINRAREIVLIASGSGKAAAVGLLASDAGPLAIPAAGVRGSDATVLMVDQSAAVHLPPGIARPD
jgi:6-phosphogluconolactonase